MTDTATRQSPPPNPSDDPAVCEYCSDRFVDDQLLALHKGLEHEGELSEDETETYRTARNEEREDIRLFRLKALVWLLVIYFGFIYVYAFVI